MDTGVWRVRTSISVVFCSLILGFVLTDVRPAMAQETCPLPAGATPPADPPVTAQDVEDGSASLEDFALAARAQFKSVGSDTLTSQQIAFSGCRLRLEGGPWRSGSTYIVTLTPDGRVFLHTKDMSLSAGERASLDLRRNPLRARNPPPGPGRPEISRPRHQQRERGP